MERRKVVFRGIEFDNYEIDKDGNIYNIKRGTKIKPFPDGRRGYLKVKLYYGAVNKKKTISVHRLMLEVFKPLDDYNDMEVDHINMNITDNRLSNLRWLTRKENYKGRKEIFSQRYDIRKWYMYALKLYYFYGFSINKISKIFNLDPQSLSNLINGRGHFHLMGKWRKYRRDKIKEFVAKGSTTRVSFSRIDMPKKMKYVQADLSKPIESTYPFLKKPRGRFKKK